MTDSHPPQPAPAQLDYAPPAAWHQRSGVRRGLVGVAVLVVLATSVAWGPTLYGRLMVLYHQRQCMAYTAPADQVVHERVLSGDGKSETAVVPEAWSEFYRILSPPGLRSGGTAFLHERRASRDAEPRLVAVDVLGTSAAAGGINGFDLYARVFDPGTLVEPPRELGTSQFRRHYGFATFSTSARVYAGQPDPHDPSHFTIVVEADDDPLVVDGWLMPDDTVILEAGGGDASP